MYPTGSNGASRPSSMRARSRRRPDGSTIVRHACGAGCLRQETLRPDLAGRAAQPRRRPFRTTHLVDDRCGGTFDNIDDVPHDEGARRLHAGWRCSSAGFGPIETLNKAPQTTRRRAGDHTAGLTAQWKLRAFAGAVGSLAQSACVRARGELCLRIGSEPCRGTRQESRSTWLLRGTAAALGGHSRLTERGASGTEQDYY